MPAWSGIFCPDGNHQSLDCGLQLWHPGRKVVHPNGFDPRVTQGVANEAMALILRQQRNVRHRRKLGGEGRPSRNARRSVCEKLAIRGSTGNAESLHIASRAISAVTIVDAHGVARKGKLRYAHRLLDAIPESSRLPNLRAVAANHRTTAWSTDTDDLARRSNVLRVEPLKLGIQVIRVDSFLRR